MATVDSLEIQIASDAKKAYTELDRITKGINSIAEALKTIDVNAISSQFKKLSDGISKIDTKGMSNISKSADGVEKSIRKVAETAKKQIKTKITFDSSDYQSAIKELSGKFSEAGKEFKFNGNFDQLQKQSDKLSASLGNLLEKQKKIISVGKISPESRVFSNLQYDISDTTNKLSILQNAIKNFKSPEAKSFEQLNPDFKIIKANADFSEIESSAEQIKSKVGSVLESIPEKARYSVEKAKESLSEAMKSAHMEEPDMGSFRNFTKEIADATAKLKELETAGKGMGSDEWDEAYIALQKVKEKAKEYKAQLDNPSDGIEDDIKQTNSLGNKIEELREKLKELKAQGLNFGDTKFDKTYVQLNKAETELKEYRTNLNSAGKESKNFSGISVPNFQKVKNSLKSMGNTVLDVGKKLASFPSIMKKFNGSTTNVSNGFKSIKGAILSAVGTIAGGVGAFNLLKESIDLSSDLTEQQNVIDVSFGKYKKSIEGLAKVSVPEFGMSELTAKTIAGRFQSMGIAIGYSQKQMSGMSVELTKLAADMASFYNVEQADVAKSLESVFTGTTAPMRRYGVDLTQATLEEWAHKQGIDAKMKSMSQAEKTMLRYQYVMANTSAAHGDFARTADTWANQIRVLKQSFEVLGSTVGGVLINVLKPFVKGLNTIMGYINEFAKTVSNALGKIFGWTFEEGGGVVNDASDATEDLAGGMEDVADATEDAKKKQKEFNKQLAKFDELNNYTTSEKGGKDKDKGSGDLSGLGSASDGKWIQGKSIVKEFESEIDSLYELGKYIGDTLKKAMDSIDWDGVYKKARNFGKGLASFLNGLISPGLFSSLGRTISNSLNTALHFLNSFGETFNWKNFGNSIAAGINSFFKNFDWELAAETFATLANGILTSALEAIKKIKWKKIGKSIAYSIKTFFKKFDWDLLPKTFNALANGILDAVLGALDEIKIKDLKKVVQKIADLISDLDVGGITFKLGKIVNKLVQSFYTIVSNKDTWKNLGQKIADGINGFFKGMNEINVETGLNGFQSLGKSFSSTISGLFKTISNTLKKTDWEKIGGSIVDVFANINWVDILTGAGDVVVSLAKGIFNLLKGALKKDIEYLKKYLPEWIKNIGTFFIELGIKIKQKAKDFSKDVEKFVKDLPRNFISILIKIGSKARDVEKKIEDFISELPKKAFGFSLKIISTAIDVSEKINNFIKGIPEKSFGFGLEILSTIEDISDKISKFIGEIPEKAVKFALKIGEKATDVAEKIEKFIPKIPIKLYGFGLKIKDKADEVGKKIKNFITTIPEKLYGIGMKVKDTPKEFKEKIESFIKKVKAIGVIAIAISATLNDAFTKPLKAAWNGLARSINAGISKINKIPGVNIGTLPTLEKGGVYKNGVWKKIAQYASGGSPTHGTLFAAGEAGPEIVGHIGSRTEVLNQSQLASVMYSAVGSAIKGTVYPYLKKISEAVRKQSIFVDFSTDEETDSQGEGDVQKEQQTEFVVSTKDIIEINSLNNDFNDMVIGWEARIEELAGKIRESVGETLKESTEDLFNGIGEKLNDTWSNAQEILSGIPEYIETNVKSPISEKISGIFEPVKGFLEETQKNIDNMKTSFVDIWNEICTVYQEAIGKLKTSSSGFFKSLNSSISSSSAKINDLLRSMGDVNIKTSSSKKFKVEKGKVAVKAYAAGGFPDTGQLFIARERGAELVGDIGGRTSVTNNDQIVEAVSEGVANAVYPAVYNAIMAAMPNSGSGDISIQIDGDSVFRVVRNKNEEFRKRNGKGAFSF